MEFENKIEEEIDSVLELNQASSSRIFYSIKHIEQAIKNSAPGPDHITVELVENEGE